MPYITGNTGGGLGVVTLTGTAAAGKVIGASSASAASWVNPPGFEIGYDQITGNVNVVSTTEATGTTVISCAAHTFDGAPVICSVFFPVVQSGTTSLNEVIVSLFEASTQITRLGIIQTPAAANMFAVWSASYRFTPTAAAHTYTITAFTGNTTGTPQINAGAGGTATNPPAYCRFTKV